MKTAIEKRKLTPPEIAVQFGVDVMKVLAWIKSGELRAIDGSARRGKRPRYLVDIEDLEAFEAARAIVPAVKPTRRKTTSLPDGFVRHFRD